MAKIIFFDIDGTLVDMETKQITAKTMETLQRLQANGIRICIATGRAPMEVPKFPGVEFDAFLTYNGSYCYSPKGKIFGNAISYEDTQTVIDNATSLGRPISLATKDRLAANGKDQDLVDYYAIANMEVEVAPDFEQVQKQEIYQMMVGGRKEEYDRLLQNTQGVKIAAWWDRALDIIPADGGKGTGVEKVLTYFHLDKKGAVAFGDGNNDIALLQAVGMGVAMGNASQALKEIADDVCLSVTEDGIYHYCKEKHFI